MKNILVLTPNIGIGGQERVAINMPNVFILFCMIVSALHMRR